MAKKTGIYFTSDTEKAIIRYNISENKDEREQLYRKHIGPAFTKLSEILIHTSKFYYINNTIEETQLDVIEFLMEKLPKYDQRKGKAFSYFTIVARNYLIIKNRTSYKQIMQKRDLSSVDYSTEVQITEQDELIREEKLDFFEPFMEYLDKNLENIFPKKNDYVIADSILEIIKRRDSLENFNKKAIYVLVKERTNMKSQQITKVVNIFKNIYRQIYINFLEEGYVDMFQIYNRKENGF